MPFKNFVIFLLKKGNFSLKFDKIYTEWPPTLESLHQKRPNFYLNPTPNDHFFSTKSHTKCPPSPPDTYYGKIVQETISWFIASNMMDGRL